MNDYRFYKFTRINENLLKSLTAGTLWFSCLKQLNDPFDCVPDIDKAIKNAVCLSRLTLKQHAVKLEKLLELLKQDEISKIFRVMLDKVGIFSSSYDINRFQTLLWAHYADNHKGLCILYEIPLSFLDDQKNIIGVSKVTYKENYLTEWFNANECQDAIDGWLKCIDQRLISRHQKITEELLNYEVELLKLVLTAKSPPWEYESEVRIIRPIWGAFAVPKSFVKQICFGLQSIEEDINKVKAALDSYDHRLPLYKAVRDGSDFGIAYDKISV
jgi:hypothetical protein